MSTCNESENVHASEPTYTELLNSLRACTDRSSSDSIAIAKQCSNAVRKQCKDMFPSDVSGCIGLWQDAHKLIFAGAEDAEDVLDQQLFCDEEFVIFLVEFAAFFGKLNSGDKDMNEILLKKRIQIYEQLSILMNIMPVEELSAEAQQLIRDRDKQCGTCHFNLNQVECAHEHLNKYASSLYTASAWKSKELSEWSSDDIESCREYCDAILEATECLKVMKKYSEAIDEYKKALQLYDSMAQECQDVGNSNLSKIGGCCNNIAMCYYHLFKYSDTIPYFERALEAFETVYGPNIPAVSMIRGNIDTNKRLAQVVEHMQAEGAEITKVDLTNPRQYDQKEEKEKYFTTSDES